MCKCVRSRCRSKLISDNITGCVTWMGWEKKTEWKIVWMIWGMRNVRAIYFSTLHMCFFFKTIQLIFFCNTMVFLRVYVCVWFSSSWFSLYNIFIDFFKKLCTDGEGGRWKRLVIYLSLSFLLQKIKNSTIREK